MRLDRYFDSYRLAPIVGRLRAWGEALHRDVSDPRFVGLALWFTAHAAAFTGWIFQLVPTLQAIGVDNVTMLQAIAIIGPMPVLGRFFLTTRGNHFSTLRVGRWAMGGLFGSVVILLVLPPRLLWLGMSAALYGASAFIVSAGAGLFST